MCAPLCATGGRPAATLAISVAVSIPSQKSDIRPRSIADCGLRIANSKGDRQIRSPQSQIRNREPSALPSPNLLELPDVRLLPVAQLKVSIERWRPGPRAFGPFDQDDGPVAYHVVESQVLRLGRGPEAVAVDVIHHAVLGRAVLVDQRVRRTGGESSSTQPPADRLDERGLAGAELTRQPDDGRRRGRAASSPCPGRRTGSPAPRGAAPRDRRSG